MTNHLHLNVPLSLDTPTGMRTTVHRTFYPADRPPLTVQSGRGWHYTSLAALRSIVGSQQLWATSWRATNDRTEVHHGLEAVSHAWDHYGREHPVAERTGQLLDEAGPISSYADSFEHVNILCAARERDSPYQWNAYASGPEGVAIGLDLGVALVTDVDDRPRRHNDAELFGMQWLKVVYTDRQKLLAAARFVTELDTSIREGAPMEVSDFRALNLLTALNFKHLAFRHEKEARCVSLSDGVELQVMPANRLKTIVPWKGLPVRATPPTPERVPLPVVEVLASPWATEATIEEIIRCLAEAGMATVPVTRSELPFR